MSVTGNLISSIVFAPLVVIFSAVSLTCLQRALDFFSLMSKAPVTSFYNQVCALFIYLCERVCHFKCAYVNLLISIICINRTFAVVRRDF